MAGRQQKEHGLRRRQWAQLRQLKTAWPPLNWRLRGSRYEASPRRNSTRVSCRGTMRSPTPDRPPTAAEIARALECNRPGCPCHITARRGAGLTHCPAHDDRHPSLSLSQRDAVLWHCHAGCPRSQVVAALRERGLWPDREDDRPRLVLLDHQPTNQGRRSEDPEPEGITLAQLAHAKGLDLDWLRELGWADAKWHGRDAVAIPYRGPDGQVIAVRYRVGLTGDRFRWPPGTRASDLLLRGGPPGPRPQDRQGPDRRGEDRLRRLLAGWPPSDRRPRAGDLRARAGEGPGRDSRSGWSGQNLGRCWPGASASTAGGRPDAHGDRDRRQGNGVQGPVRGRPDPRGGLRPLGRTADRRRQEAGSSARGPRWPRGEYGGGHSVEDDPWVPAEPEPFPLDALPPEAQSYAERLVAACRSTWSAPRHSACWRSRSAAQARSGSTRTEASAPSSGSGWSQPRGREVTCDFLCGSTAPQGG